MKMLFSCNYVFIILYMLHYQGIDYSGVFFIASGQ